MNKHPDAGELADEFGMTIHYGREDKVAEHVRQLSEEIRKEFRGIYGEPPFLDWADRTEELESGYAAWREAFMATRAYYSNNNGPNSTRYRAAVKRLKEMKLIK